MSYLIKSRFLTIGLLISLLIGCDDNGNNSRGSVAPDEVTLEQQSLRLPSSAQPARTPGSPGVVVDNPRLLEQFGPEGPDLNHAVYTRYFLSDAKEMQPDAILVLMPGFEGGASNFAALADQLMRRMRDEASMVLEVWAMDRRSEQLEDRIGLDLAEEERDPSLGLDFLFGDDLGLELDPRLQENPGRRLISYNTGADLAFMANWTYLVHSLDIDAVVKRAAEAARSGNVFLGGHSAGTGYAANYAATDFDPSPDAVDAGYTRLRGLVLLEGGGGALAEPPDDALLDQVEARFDGGLYGAVRDQAPRCIDGLTACTVENQAADCAAFSNTTCTEPIAAYATGLINTQTFAAGELVALEGDFTGDQGLSILQQDQRGIEGNNALAVVPELLPVLILIGNQRGTSVSLYGQYLDDDGLGAAAAPFLATSIGAPGPEVDGITTWLNYDEPLPDEVLPDNGPAPEEPRSGGVWGQEREVTDFKGRILRDTYRGGTNFFDWYYPSSGLIVTEGLGLDTTALSAPPPLGRGRSDIDNRTQARRIDIPVIGFGGSNGLTPVPGSYLAFAEAIAPCGAPSCDDQTPRVLETSQPSVAFPSFGGVSGGYEVYISEGYAHVDILTAQDGETNQVIGPLLAFIQRNSR
jgi:pimeloyl-ACP methyl ester carboxylesterase